MSTVFKYEKSDKLVKRLTLMWFILTAGTVALVWYLWGEGGYAIAWTISLLVALYTLCILSIPRNIIVTDSALEIRCIVEITRIQLCDIRSIRPVRPHYMKNIYPFVAGYGLFGYYGHYVDTKRLTTVKLYCTRWSDFVEITDIYEKRYYINCKESEKLIRTVKTASAYYIPNK